MMDLVWLIYIIDTLLTAINNISNAFIFFAFILPVMYWLIYGMIGNPDGDDPKAPIRKKVNRFSILFIFIGGILMFVPTKDTAYKMLTVYGAVELSKIEEVKQLSEKSYKVLNKVLDDYLDENEEK